MTETDGFTTLADMETLHQRIRHIRSGLDLTQEEFADALNDVLRGWGEPAVTRGAIGNWELSKLPAMRNMNAIVEVAQIDLNWLANGRGPEPAASDLARRGAKLKGTMVAKGLGLPAILPGHIDVFGQAAGSTLAEGASILFDQSPIGTLPMLPGLVGMRDIYGLEVTGDSMLPMYRSGEPVYVSPHSAVSRDDPCILIEHRSNNGRPRAFIKIFVASKTDHVEARQLNPEGKLRFMKKPGLDVHKVLTLPEIMGYSGVEVEAEPPPGTRLKRR